MHGHIETLLEAGITKIFYPSLTYNVDEKASVNHYNCPIVAYYAELLQGNMEHLQQADFWYPYLNINSKAALRRTLYAALHQHDATITRGEIARAVDAGFAAYADYTAQVLSLIHI